jgi:hypothetical protein
VRGEKEGEGGGQFGAQVKMELLNLERGRCRLGYDEFDATK